MIETARREFANGRVFAMKTLDHYPVEITDTYLPTYTRDAIGKRGNRLTDGDFGDRSKRWMVGVSVMSGCPVGCKFCATGQLPKWRPLTALEIVLQVRFVVDHNPEWSPAAADEFKVNYTRMGEPFLNLNAVRKAIEHIEVRWPGTHHYVSTIGIRGADYGWITDYVEEKGINITLQLSVHTTNPQRRLALIPYPGAMSLGELAAIQRVRTRQKITVNMTLVDEADFDIDALKSYFPPEHFFIKLSPINPNATSERFRLGAGVIDAKNLA
jgi:23S rRNA (adenine2503-C2)-methyltransferase